MYTNKVRSCYRKTFHWPQNFFKFVQKMLLKGIVLNNMNYRSRHNLWSRTLSFYVFFAKIHPNPQKQKILCNIHMAL